MFKQKSISKVNELMNFLLNASKSNITNLLHYDRVLVVLGNETCDLDSAVSSLVYSLLLHHQEPPDSIIIPVFNIPRLQLPVKTEVTYFLNKYGINLDNIVCRDEIDLEALQAHGSLQLTLVDHHALQQSDCELVKSVVAVIDHRPPDPAWQWPHADLTLHTVASCCTLVAEKLFAQAPELITPSVAILLLGTILLDSACLSPTAGRATLCDHQMADQLEAHCGQSIKRAQLFNELREAKSDVSSLTSAQLLIKDLKVTAGIPIAGLPMKVEKFLERPDANSTAWKFCEEHNVELCVMYGSEKNSRDIAVFSHSNSNAASQVVAALIGSKEPNLDLQPQPCLVQGFRLFEQLNVKATRKQFLPIIRQVGEKLQDS